MRHEYTPPDSNPVFQGNGRFIIIIIIIIIIIMISIIIICLLQHGQMLNRCLTRKLVITNNQTFLVQSSSFISILTVLSIFLLFLIMWFFLHIQIYFNPYLIYVFLKVLCNTPRSLQDHKYHVNFLKVPNSLNLSLEILILLNFLLFLVNCCLVPRYCLYL